MTLISPNGGRDDSSIFAFNFSSFWSLPTKCLNFPCLIRFSICCFKSKHSSMSCPWSLWKRQYLFLLRLLGSPFIFPGHFRDGSSLICMSTWSSGTFKGVNSDSLLGGLPSYYPCLSYLPFVPSLDEDLVRSVMQDWFPSSQLSSSFWL